MAKGSKVTLSNYKTLKPGNKVVFSSGREEVVMTIKRLHGPAFWGKPFTYRGSSIAIDGTLSGGKSTSIEKSDIELGYVYFYTAQKASSKRVTKTKSMAKTRVLAKVGIKAKSNELVYYKDGVLYAVERKTGGTKGAKRKSCKKAAPKKKTAKKAAPKKRAVKKTATKRTPAKKRSNKQGKLF